MSSSTTPLGVAASAPETPGARPARILLVEDHADTREGLLRMLQLHGFHAQGAGSCADALVMAAEMSAGRLDVIVSDVGLPDGDGVELMRTVMKRHACPAVALTGWDAPDDLRRYAAAGIRQAFIKPVDVTGLLKALATLVGGA